MFNSGLCFLFDDRIKCLNNAVLTTNIRLTIILKDQQSDGDKMINQKVASNSQRGDADEVAIDHLPSVINNT